MKSIETKYKGYRFRSRLEARWAVFFDSIGWKLEYEPEGFELPSGRYLPDFVLIGGEYKQQGRMLWVEVKCVEPNDREKTLARELTEYSKIPIVFAVGTTEKIELDGYSIGLLDPDDPDSTETKLAESLANIGNYSFSKWKRPGWLLYQPDLESEDVAAITAARSARFEFGETPQ